MTGDSLVVLPISTLPAGSGALTVLDVETLLRRLPAEARARVAWAKKPIEVALGRLRAEPLTDALLDEAATAVSRPLTAIARALWEAVAAAPEEWRASLMEDLQRDEERLRAFLPDDDARDTLDWIGGFCRTLFDCVFAVARPAPIAQLGQEAIERLADERDFRSFIGGQVALMAAVDAAKANEGAESARDLVDVAFLELVRVRNLLRTQGLWFSAFPHETTEERRRRVLVDAERLRRATTHDDWQVVEAARMRDLR
jgi:hypothetical protein